MAEQRNDAASLPVFRCPVPLPVGQFVLLHAADLAACPDAEMGVMLNGTDNEIATVGDILRGSITLATGALAGLLIKGPFAKSIGSMAGYILTGQAARHIPPRGPDRLVWIRVRDLVPLQ